MRIPMVLDNEGDFVFPKDHNLKICPEGLREYFEIPEEVMKLDIVLSKRQVGGSYFVRPSMIRRSVVIVYINKVERDFNMHHLFYGAGKFLSENFPDGVWVSVQY